MQRLHAYCYLYWGVEPGWLLLRLMRSQHFCVWAPSGSTDYAQYVSFMPWGPCCLLHVSRVLSAAMLVDACFWWSLAAHVRSACYVLVALTQTELWQLRLAHACQTRHFMLRCLGQPAMW